MKATGIIRRVDDLGRVVIPKAIRKALKIKEGDPLEIYTEGSDTVCFRRYQTDLVGDTRDLFENIECYYEGENKAEVMDALDVVIQLMRKGQE